MAIGALFSRKGGEFAGSVYGIKPDGFRYLKIGYCRDNYDRLKTLQVAWPVDLKYAFIMPGDRDLESSIQRALWPSHVRGDWFHQDSLVALFLERLGDEFPESKPTVAEIETKPACAHFVRLGGYACEKCGLSKLLISNSPLPEFTRPNPPATEEKS